MQSFLYIGKIYRKVVKSNNIIFYLIALNFTVGINVQIPNVSINILEVVNSFQLIFVSTGNNI